MKTEPNDPGQVIYMYSVQLTWKVTSGKSYTNHYKGLENSPYKFVSRAKTIDDINRNPEIVMRIMMDNGLTGKKIKDFHINKCFDQKEVSRSFAFRESDYEKEFNKMMNK
jgi:hypothetical protein